MSQDQFSGDGMRERISIEGESFYLICGFDEGRPYLHVTVPDENKPTGRALRQVAETICARATERLGVLAGGGQ